MLIIYSVTGPAGMTISAAGLIQWTPTATGNFSVTARATNGVNPAAQQSYTLVVVADQAPTCQLTRPLSGELVSGSTAEFFGDGFDDVGCVSGSFYVDNVLGYTDNTPGGHYHFGAVHNAWNTLAYGNGMHRVRLTVTDTAGATCSAEVDVMVDNPGATPDLSGLPMDLGVVDMTAIPVDAAQPAEDASLPVDAMADDGSLPLDASAVDGSLPVDAASGGADGLAALDAAMPAPAPPGCSCRVGAASPLPDMGLPCLLALATCCWIALRRRKDSVRR
jgi:hypothetical protein